MKDRQHLDTGNDETLRREMTEDPRSRGGTVFADEETHG